MNNTIFRKKSIERISSPEQLQDYIRVSNPGIWLLLVGIIAILAGFCVWCTFGHMESKLPVPVICGSGMDSFYVSEENVSKVAPGMEVRVGEDTAKVVSVATEPFAVDESFPEYACHVGGFSQGQWVYGVQLDTLMLEPGVYRGELLVESVSPMSFLLN